MRLTSLAPALVLVASACLLASCGGGGGGGGSGGGLDASVFTGDYGFFSLSVRQGSPDVGTGEWGSATADGAGTISSGSVSTNEAGTLSGPNPIVPSPYTVGSAGEFSIVPDATTNLSGGVSADGRAAVTAGIANGQDPGLLLLLRQSGAFDDTSLTGTYHFMLYGFVLSSTDVTYLGATIAFDGAGAATLTVPSFNTDGSVNASGLSDAGTYSVSAAGRLILTIVGVTLNGQVLEGGEVAFMSGTAAADDAQVIAVMIRQASGLSTSTFSGTYHSVEFENSAGGSFGWRAVTQSATADGAGGLNFATGVENRDGTVGAAAAFATDYTVAPDGSLSAGSGGFVGAVSSDGRFAAITGGTQDMSNPVFRVFIR